MHGGIDGFSRLIVYLYCSTNNSASTVIELFERACSLFGVPSRVRSDIGGENVGVCEYMIRTRGTDRGSHIARPSTHNQRINRLWRDVFRCVCSTFHGIFHYLEEIVRRHVCTSVHFRSRSLTEFACAWNYHPLRTERNWSPRKIWMNGTLGSDNQDNFTTVPDIVKTMPTEGLEAFGQDPSFDAEPIRSTVAVNSPDCTMGEIDTTTLLIP